MYARIYFATGFNQRSIKLVISIRIVSKLNSDATGFCIQPLATKIHIAEKLEPNATQYVVNKCLAFDKRSHQRKINQQMLILRKMQVMLQ